MGNEPDPIPADLRYSAAAILAATNLGHDLRDLLTDLATRRAIERGRCRVERSDVEAVLGEALRTMTAQRGARRTDHAV